MTVKPPIATGPAKVRKVRTPAQRAQEALDVVDRQIARVKERIIEAERAVGEVKKELAPLEKRREYLAANPDLPPQAVGKDAPAFSGAQPQTDE